MKNKLILIVGCLLVFSNIAFAQNVEEIEKQVESQIEKAPSKRMGKLDGTPEVPSSRGMHTTVTAGINDNLTLPTEPVFKSPNLGSIFLTTKDFDDQSVNKIFAYSFPLNKYHPCQSKACKAQLLIRVCNSGADLWTNDKIYVGTADSGKFVPTFFNATFWNPSGSEAKTCKDVKIPLNPSSLAGMNFLDVVMQDDSTIDYMQLDLDY